MQPNSNDKFNFNSNKPNGNGIFGSPASNINPNPDQPAPSPLRVHVTSPTHFDQPRPIATNPADQPNPALESERALKKLSTLSLVFGILAGVFLFFAIGGSIFGVISIDKLKKANSDLNNKNAIISTLENNTGISPIDSPEKVPVFKATKDYIHIPEWGIKIKIPADLTSVSYILNQQYRPSICFNAYKKGVQYFPAFADVAKNPGGMGCLTRIATSEGDTNTENSQSFGTKVFTSKGYNYFYTAPVKDFSKDAAELGLEHTAVQIIKNMLTDNVNQYE